MSVLPGVCCAFCVHHKTDACPVKTASPWNRWEGYCGSYEPNLDNRQAVALKDAVLHQVTFGASTDQVASAEPMSDKPTCVSYSGESETQSEPLWSPWFDHEGGENPVGGCIVEHTWNDTDYHGKAFKLFAGYGLVNVEHEANRTWMTPPGYSGPAAAIPWDIMYEGKSTLWDASAAFNINETGKLGAYVNLYNNSGFWEIKRTMLKAYFQYDLPYGMFTEIALRHVNFEEAMAETNDYKTNILELNFGYRWQ